MREKQEFEPSAAPTGPRCHAFGIVCKVVVAIHVLLGLGIGLAAWTEWS